MMKGDRKTENEIGQLKITRYGSKDMIKTMENCIKNGF
jgi:archaellum component FlaC